MFSQLHISFQIPRTIYSELFSFSYFMTACIICMDQQISLM